MTNGGGKSDSPVVPRKPPNKVERSTAEVVEERELAKGNSPEPNAPRTQDRVGALSGLERVRQAARKDRKLRFTTLLHHVYDLDRLRAAYKALKPKAAAGVDGITWREYGEALEENLQDLADRVQRGAYRAKPTRRAHIPKADGRLRPIGIPALEDKIVQRAVVEVLNAIYEEDFVGFSYGFRPGRSQHDALDALVVGLKQKVSWVLDADIRGFFDSLDHGWLVKFIEHRVADKRVVRLIQKWLNAGVVVDGEVTRSGEGTVQGGSISPLLANVYLHYVFDLWVQRWRTSEARGEVIVVRYADDFIVGFQRRDEAERFLVELRERFAQFALELHPEKTRLLEFGRFARSNHDKRGGGGKPGTFNFLGFTHICAKTRRGWFQVLRQTMRQRWQAKLGEIKAELRRRMHRPVPEQGQYLRSVVRGHVNYYGVPGNSPAIGAFAKAVIRLWHRTLCRRSQTPRLPWKRMARYVARWIPPARVSHPYPEERFGVTT